MTVLEVGPAMGFFTLPMAAMVGPTGRIICVDVQERMVQALLKRARAAQLADRILPRVCGPTALGLDDFTGAFDFALAFAVVHEMPDPPSFFADLARLLRPGARCLLAEPKGRVRAPAFEATLAAARQAGLGLGGQRMIRRCRAAVLQKE
jgi:predicted O-methyltransferase YrrM